MSKEYLLFDLDGTLTDPMEGITKAVQYALKHYGIRGTGFEKFMLFYRPAVKRQLYEILRLF